MRASSTNTAELSLFEETCRKTTPTHNVMEVLPFHQFHILVVKFFSKKMHLLRYMMALYTKSPSISVKATPSILSHYLPMRNPESIEKTKFSGVHSVSCKKKKLSAHYKLKQATPTTTDSPYILRAAVHYKPTIDGKS